MGTMGMGTMGMGTMGMGLLDSLHRGRCHPLPPDPLKSTLTHCSSSPCTGSGHVPMHWFRSSQHQALYAWEVSYLYSASWQCMVHAQPSWSRGFTPTHPSVSPRTTIDVSPRTTIDVSPRTTSEPTLLNPKLSCSLSPSCSRSPSCNRSPATFQCTCTGAIIAQEVRSAF